MPGPSNTVLVEGDFEELARELASYIDDINAQKPTEAGDEAEEEGPVAQEVTSLLEANQKDEVLKRIVTAAPALNKAPEKGRWFATGIHAYAPLTVPRVHRSLQPPRTPGSAVSQL